MNLADVMDELGAALDTIDGLRVTAWPADRIQVPAAIVGYPISGTFDVTMGRGVDQLEIPVAVVVSRVSARAARDALAPYCDGSGASSVKAALQGATYTAASSVRVRGVEFDPFDYNAVQYLAATFAVDVYGSGS